jgi:hypothetical protein
MSEHESDAALSRRVAEAAGYTSMTVIKGNLIGHAPGKADTGRRAVPKFAESLDAIAALEREAGLLVDVMWTGQEGDCTALAFRKGSSELLGRRKAETEPRARCLAFLSYKEHTT